MGAISDGVWQLASSFGIRQNVFVFVFVMIYIGHRGLGDIYLDNVIIRVLIIFLFNYYNLYACCWGILVIYDG